MHGYELRTQDDGSVALIEFTPTVIATFWDRSHAERYFGILCEFEVADASHPIFYPEHQTASSYQLTTSGIDEETASEPSPDNLMLGSDTLSAVTAATEVLPSQVPEALITKTSPEAPAGAEETVAAAAASSGPIHSMKTKPIRSASQPFRDPSDAEWEDAFKALDRGEKLKVLADDLRVNPYKLQGKFGAWKKKRKPEDQAPDDLEECRLCGTTFRATVEGPDLCARCSRG